MANNNDNLLNEKTSIPINLLVLCGVPLLSFITTYAAANFRIGALEDRVRTIETKLDERYVRKEEMSVLADRLNRIDEKLDKLIEKGTEERVIPWKK